MSVHVLLFFNKQLGKRDKVLAKQFKVTKWL